jgi:hypothetical protein
MCLSAMVDHDDDNDNGRHLSQNFVLHPPPLFRDARTSWYKRHDDNDIARLTPQRFWSHSPKSANVTVLHCIGNQKECRPKRTL